MKKIFSFVLSIALMGNIAYSTVALGETNPKVEKPIPKSSTIRLNSTYTNDIDPDSFPE